MAGRKAGFRHNEETRAKIQASALITRLMDHITSDQPIMDASQVNAAKALLNKVLPDLSAVEHSGEMTVETVSKEQRDAAVQAASRANT
jgi:hypothetical protein